MKTWPLRWRIAIWSALVSALALLTLTVVVAVNLYAEQVEMIDAQLAAMAQFVGIHGETGFDLEALAAQVRTARPLTGVPAPLYGFALARTADRAILEARPASFAFAVTHWPPSRWPPPRKFSNATLGGVRLRIGAFAHGGTTLLLAAPREPAEESVSDLLSASLIAIPAVLLVVAGGSWWIARRALAPIAAVTRAAAAITADRLGERLPPPQTTDEIGQHIEVLNGMFDRLQRSFEQATRFTADAAHELRTPLTIMRGQVEDALRSDSAAPEQEQLLLGLLEEISGLQKISENLLLLARFDTGRNPLQRRPLDLSGLLGDAAEDAELLATPKGVRIIAAIEPGVRIEGDSVMLRRMALNLIDNAVKFNRAGGELRLTLDAAGGEGVFTVGNTGPGIASDQRAALFERFHRGDTDRNRASGGSGLGLSLCREIVTAHGGQIALGRAEADWTEFTVRLPQVAVASA